MRAAEWRKSTKLTLLMFLSITTIFVMERAVLSFTKDRWERSAPILDWWGIKRSIVQVLEAIRHG